MGLNRGVRRAKSGASKENRNARGHDRYGVCGPGSGACLSEFGHSVVCVDKDAGKIAALKAGKIPIFEPGLDEVVATNVKAGRLSFTDTLADAVKEADAVFIAVGTPSRRGDGHADLSFVFAAAEEVAHAMDGYTVVITKSTVPVGTSRKVEDVIRKARPDAQCDVVSNPEFLREGSAIEDFRRPDRVVVGCDSERARDVLAEIYRPLYLNETPILFTSRESSELIKYAANAFHPAPAAMSVEKVYDATPHTILAVIKDAPATAHTLMVIGHNPGLYELALMLIAAGDVDARERLREKLPTSGLVIIDFAFDNWNKLHPQSGRLERFISPKSLEAAAN